MQTPIYKQANANKVAFLLWAPARWEALRGRHKKTRVHFCGGCRLKAAERHSAHWTRSPKGNENKDKNKAFSSLTKGKMGCVSQRKVERVHRAREHRWKKKDSAVRTFTSALLFRKKNLHKGNETFSKRKLVIQRRWVFAGCCLVFKVTFKRHKKIGLCSEHITSRKGCWGLHCFFFLRRNGVQVFGYKRLHAHKKYGCVAGNAEHFLLEHTTKLNVVG